MITNIQITSRELPTSALSDANSRRSICVRGLSYDDELLELTVALPGGSWVFYGVRPRVFEAFLRSRSLGSFFNRLIRNVYHSRRV